MVGTDFKSTKIEQIGNKNECTDERRYIIFVYRSRAIITHGLYIFNPLFEGQKRFFKEVFSENSACMCG